MPRLLIVLWAMFLWGCSSQKVAGGSDLPNGVIGGVVVASKGESVIGGEATLSSVVLGARGDSTVSTSKTEIGVGGTYRFTDVEKGTYVLSFELPNSERALVSRIEKGDDSLVLASIQAQSTVAVRGRIVSDGVLPDSVVVLGTSLGSAVSSLGEYCVDDVPVGGVELVAVGEQGVSVLSVELEPTSRDTLYVRDVRYSPLDGVPYELYSSPVEGCVVAYPELYGNEQEPLWYNGKDFDGVVYVVAQYDDPRQLWYLPVWVELSSSVVEQCGSFELAVAKVRSQFSRANEFYANKQFDGRIHFSVNLISEGITTGTTPSQYAMRVVYVDSVSTSLSSSFNDRVVVMAGESLLESSADTKLQSLLAFGRGAQFLNSTEVAAGRNPLTGESYQRSKLLMWGDGGSELDMQTVGIINRNGDTKTPVAVGGSDFASQLRIVVTSNGEPVPIARVTAYGVSDARGLDDQSPRYSGDANNGVFTFPENPFVLGGDIIEYKNYLLEIIVADSVQYVWMPYFEVVGDYLSGNESVYDVAVSF